jgi:hypothetical protein
MDNNTNPQNQEPQTPVNPVTPPQAPAPTTPEAASIPTGTTSDPGQNESGKKPSNKMLIIVIASLALLVILAVIFIILGNNMMKPTPTTDTLVPPSEPTPTEIIVPTATPSAESIETLDVGNPTTDINTIEQDASQL